MQPSVDLSLVPFGGSQKFALLSSAVSKEEKKMATKRCVRQCIVPLDIESKQMDVHNEVLATRSAASLAALQHQKEKIALPAIPLPKKHALRQIQVAHKEFVAQCVPIGYQANCPPQTSRFARKKIDFTDHFGHLAGPFVASESPMVVPLQSARRPSLGPIYAQRDHGRVEGYHSPKPLPIEPSKPNAKGRRFNPNVWGNPAPF